MENWQVTVPCVAGEFDLEFLMANESKEHSPEPQASAPKAEQKPEASKAPAKEEGPKLAENQVEHFNKYIELKVAKILSVENNPQGEKLYIEHLDDGSGTERIIQSGLRPYLTPEELLGQHVIIAANLAPRKMRGVESHGMLLATDYQEDGKDKVELLTAPWAEPGTPVILEGADPAAEKPAKIDIDKFCKVEIKIAGKTAQVDGVKLVVAGKPITTQKSDNCLVE